MPTCTLWGIPAYNLILSLSIYLQRDSKSRLKVLSNFSLNEQQSFTLLNLLETDGQYSKVASVLRTITRTDGPVSKA